MEANPTTIQSQIPAKIKIRLWIATLVVVLIYTAHHRYSLEADPRGVGYRIDHLTGKMVMVVGDEYTIVKEKTPPKLPKINW